MKRILAMLLCLAMVLGMTACGGETAPESTAPEAGGTSSPESTAPEAGGEVITLRASSSTAPSHPYNMGLEKFAELVSERTNGQIKIDIFANAQLGDERANIEDLQMGTLDIAVSSTGPLGNFIEDYLILDLPYLFSGYDHAHAVLDGEIGQNLMDKLGDLGIVGGAFWENGFREMTNSKHPINTPEDCKGLKLRCMENQAHIAAFSALGMDPTPMAWSEVFSALQQGVIDGQENPIAVIYSNAVYEAQQYLAITNHVYSASMILFSKSTMDKLTPEQQQILLDASKEVADYERGLCEDGEAEQIAEMEQAGLEVTYPDIALFQEALSGVYDEFAEQFGQENIDAIRNYQF
ncbi:MAG: DctP family TRAP transporter solute-binding subunit [Candidatus Heteroscillospira sp.]|jgi:tripartite ATP-independent transporter DctP family solute receptor